MKKSLLLSCILAIVFIAAFPGQSVTADDHNRTVTIWTFATNREDDIRQIQGEIESRFAVHIEIKLIPQYNFIDSLTRAMRFGKDTPDIIDWMIENNRMLSANPDNSYVMPLNQFVNRSAGVHAVPQGRMDWCTYGDYVYGIPGDVHPVVLVYNDTLWKEAGVDLETIETWDQFFEAAKKLISKKKNGKPIHYALPYGNNGLQTSMFMIWQQTGTQILDPYGNPDFTNPDFALFVKKWREWVKSGVFCDWDWGQFGNMLESGIMAAYPAPDWWVSRVDDAAKNSSYKFKVRPLPVYRAGGSRTASWGGTFMAIPKTVDNPVLMFQIMEYIQFNRENERNFYLDTGILPVDTTVYNDPVFDRPDARFGGIKLGRLQCDLALGLPAIKTGDIFWDAINDFTEQYHLLEAGTLTVEECLENTQKEAMKRIKNQSFY
ncbi:MAG: extracellular solute-binding protein [Spirochaetales bacterium]|nr:extracellular solute-binding protein [Spirochaetales bacterium]